MSDTAPVPDDLQAGIDMLENEGLEHMANAVIALRAKCAALIDINSAQARDVARLRATVDAYIKTHNMFFTNFIRDVTPGKP